jgi:CRISPR/Cas system-associated protein Csm6
MPLALIPLILKLAPVILGLIRDAVNLAHDNKLLAAGQAEAIAEGARQVEAQVEIARQAEAEAAKKQAQHPNDDGGFDPDFQRKD